MIKILSIAGSDPSGGAGIQVDLKTFQSLGAFGMAIPAALTAQSSRGVFSVSPVPSADLKRQLKALLSDIKPAAVKTGMLLTRANVDAVAAAVKEFRIRNLIIDPVLLSSSGRTLLRKDAVPLLRKKLLPLALVVTPNIMEAEALAGMAIRSEQDMDFAAGRILDLGPSYVLIKGGHRASSAAEDTLYGGQKVLAFSTPWRSGEVHGTGCVLSSAVAVFIGRGYAVEKAVEKAKEHVDTLLRKAKPAGKNRNLRYFQI
ncbi:MAG: bifunctional hydroxymethylpyrimidine kinase/phosphomethylpyrimidine kinase [Nitrospirae bacterium GWC2_57_13]|jgi:hydroxymethylpyrimidine/phosphomethylpyrimidine kinase|nr:MAG: bifunctional hydroxymethylpyrimidine kinase/phosphomethylpyrimidine kinase [Nitrospirae bacterium GWC1_57_7]OGW28026.1 MAG: bifunctional hydroxymethylpyrimidine kinase/phosphomethylpyrimidine kinase [Nitrospirae bacterium GWC2_57_13]OGW43830.1 MAG: bifunctional hydroxymethylpyrimidine kinase/phosphomethylpyrimidine kinase [Nitrospirae bacterium GWD2_57_8]HAR44828.1 bifunctional hydroxymethylpyrimidine kinase/phosphomethylpyrimidine kinase [Nitrospiraceae bacterium]